MYKYLEGIKDWTLRSSAKRQLAFVLIFSFIKNKYKYLIKCIKKLNVVKKLCKTEVVIKR
jgi:hypothetical protein